VRDKGYVNKQKTSLKAGLFINKIGEII